MNSLLIGLLSILFQTIKSAELVIKKDDNKALPLKGNRPGANLWTDEALTDPKGSQNGGFADDSGNQVRRPIGQWEEPPLPQATDNLKSSDPQSFPQIGIDSRGRPDSVLTSEKAKERGWNNWNSPSLSLEPENDWANSWNEPSLLPLPQQSWGNNGPGKQWSNGPGKNNWGLPSLPDQSNHWNEPLGSDLLPPPSPISEPERERGWGGSKWSASQNQMSDPIEEKRKEWAPIGPSNPWVSQSKNNDNKPVCDCEERSNGQNKNNENQSRGKYPNYPASPSYAPIRPNRPQKQQAWNHFENLPWSSWERGIKDKKLPNLKDVDNAEKVEEVSETLVEAPEDTGETLTPTEPNEIEERA